MRSHFTFFLPGDWLSLDLTGSEEQVDKRIHTLIAKAVGPRDDLASVRYDLRTRLADVVRRGRAVRADEVHLAQKLVGDVPFPVSLLVSRPGAHVPVAGSVTAAAAQLLELMPGDETSTVPHETLAVARTVSRPKGDDASSAETLVADYWVVRPGMGGLTAFTFSSGLVALEAVLLKLFDAMILNVRLREQLTTPS